MLDVESGREVGLFCVLCAAYSYLRWGALGSPCKCSIEGRESQLSSVRNGCHPNARVKVSTLRQCENSKNSQQWDDRDDDERGLDFRQAWEL
eukprot:5279155-Amphidinium_carterae.2